MTRTRNRYLVRRGDRWYYFRRIPKRYAHIDTRTYSEAALNTDSLTRILPENYFLPRDLERQIESFVEHDNHERYHESLKNVMLTNVYFGRARSI